MVRLSWERNFVLHLREAVNFKTCAPLENTTWVSNWPHDFYTGGATKSQARSHQCPTVDKMSQEKGSLLFGITLTYERNGLHSL